MLLKEICDHRFKFFWDINQTKYVYDLNGNMISKQEKGMSGKVWNYSYSSENQMTQAELFEGTTKLKSVRYFYDVMGRRIKKIVQDLQNSTSFERKFVYDSSEIIAELDEDSNILARYTHSGLRTDDVLAAEISPSGVSSGLASQSGSYFYLKDGLGSINAITTETGNIVQRYIYSSFGKLLKVVDSIGAESTTIKTSYSYTNREFDEETGLFYYRARYYDSHNGRFLQEDPDPGNISIPQTVINSYSYVGNEPISRVDPTGQSFLGKLGVIGLGLLLGGPFGALVAINLSSEFTSGEKMLANTIAIVAVAIVTGGAAGAAFGAAAGGGVMGAIAGTFAGAIIGGLSGGFVGGFTNSLQGQDFLDGFSNGFGIGAIAGGIAGGVMGYGVTLPSRGAILNATLDRFAVSQSLLSKQALIGYGTFAAKQIANLSCGSGRIYSFSAGGKCIEKPALFWEQFI